MVEASSPLACMQQPAFMGHYAFSADPPPYASYAAKNLGSSFNFRDMSMKRAHSSDYFNMKPVRGSSPTASLAADLSQNFHIDQSPQLPTPRRALFSTNIFANVKVSLTTPPIPTSSPGVEDSMDISPLPHKPAYQITLASPTPDLTPADSVDVPSIPSIPSPPSSESPFDSSLLRIPDQRRKPMPGRPGLSRAKGYSTSTIPQAPSFESQGPAFRFGNGALYHRAVTSSLSLSEAFLGSPIQEIPSPPTMPPPGPRLQLFGHQRTQTSRGTSPAPPSSRKPQEKRKKLTRRSLSMFEQPCDVMKHQEMDVSSLPPIMDESQPYEPRLPHFTREGQENELPRITKDTLIDILDGKYNQLYQKRVIIDCRFEYEYAGGHIAGAINYNDKEQLSTQLFDVEPTSNALLIFHCEYSAHRAPLMAKFIRNKDRAVNVDNYPNLTYPEAYILDGGYSSFFSTHSFRCDPQNYVLMDDKAHAEACERGMGKVKQRSKLIRAQTFAFGEHSPGLDSSPTANCIRSRSIDEMEVDSLEFTPLPVRPSLGSIGRRGGVAMRMFSY